MKPEYRIILATLVLGTAAPSALAQQAPPPPTSYTVPSNWGGPGVGRGGWESREPSDVGFVNRNINKAANAQPVRPVPEPSQWALMGAGMGLVAWIVRRRSKRNPD